MPEKDAFEHESSYGLEVMFSEDAREAPVWEKRPTSSEDGLQRPPTSRSPTLLDGALYSTDPFPRYERLRGEHPWPGTPRRAGRSPPTTR